MSETSETFADAVRSFTLPARNARGRVVRIDSVADDVLSAHAYPPAVTHLLAEALVVAALIGSLLKEPGSQMTMQAQQRAGDGDDGAIRLMVCDYREGELRGYVDFDDDRLSELGPNPPLEAMFGDGYLAITFDCPAGAGGRYQGIVPLEGASLAAACEAYFVQSEQVPTLLRVAVQSGEGGCRAGGLLVQHLADGEEGRERLHVRLDHPEWEHVSILAGTIGHGELLDMHLSLEALVWRLFHEEEEVRVQSAVELGKGCRCSVEHYDEVISRFSEDERTEMRNDEGNIVVDCAFCSRAFTLTA